MMQGPDSDQVLWCDSLLAIDTRADREGWANGQVQVDFCGSQSYLALNRTPHASASVCAPGGSFFALNPGMAGFQ